MTTNEPLWTLTPRLAEPVGGDAGGGGTELPPQPIDASINGVTRAKTTRGQIVRFGCGEVRLCWIDAQPIGKVPHPTTRTVTRALRIRAALTSVGILFFA